ncbi:MBL fold metallo-hydrolase [Streptomyces polygonati]|uniref:MBL fold metallo-hydrolase n=1 Tax=Streptomyces polygonati TaxID=1617087 RepID=A0ABV8HVS5_9ACTN
MGPLVDPLMTVDESRLLADWVVEQGKNVTTVFVTHAHGDHFFGAPSILERFPSAKLVATPGVVEHMGAQWGPQWFDAFWEPRFADQISDRHVMAEPLEDRPIDLEGEQLQAIELGHTDTDGTSALHVPSIGLVVAGTPFTVRCTCTSPSPRAPGWRSGSGPWTPSRNSARPPSYRVTNETQTRTALRTSGRLAATSWTSLTPGSTPRTSTSCTRRCSVSIPSL